MQKGNPKSQIRNPKQIQIPNDSNPKRFGIGILDFDIVSDFVLRISDFPEGAVSDFGFFILLQFSFSVT
jgi:hypothetical protein